MNTTKQVNTSNLWWASLVGAMGAVVANVIFLFIFQALADMWVLGPDPAGGTVPVSAVLVGIFSFVPGLLAGLFLWALDRFTDSPVKIFYIVAGVGLVVSFIPNLLIAGMVGWSSAIALMIMHVIAAAAIVGALRQFALR